MRGTRGGALLCVAAASWVVGALAHEHARHATELMDREAEALAAVELGQDDGARGEDDVMEVIFRVEGPLGIQFKEDLSIMAFREIGGGRLGAAEKSGLLHIGDTLLAVNGDDVTELTTYDAFQVLDEAARLSADTGAPRRFLFRRGSNGPQERALTEEGRLAARPDAVAEHIDVRDADGLEHTFRIMMAATDLGGAPTSCEARPLVFIEPSDGCDEDLVMTPHKALDGALVVIKRGACSFQRKARAMSLLGASGVLVINSEDRLFRMEPDALAPETFAGLPMAMLAFPDGERLARLRSQRAADMNLHLRAKLVASQDCEALEVQKEALAAAKARGDKSFFQTSGALQEVGHSAPEHRRFGALAPAGTLGIVNSTDGPLDFIAAAYSAPLPVGEDIELAATPQQDACVIVAQEATDDLQYRRILQLQRRASELACVIVVSRGSDMHRLISALPSECRVPVMMVSESGGRRLQASLAQQGKIRLEPSHSVWHRWQELDKLKHPSRWPSSQSAQERLANRLATQHRVSPCRLARLLTISPAPITVALAAPTFHRSA